MSLGQERAMVHQLPKASVRACSSYMAAPSWAFAESHSASAQVVKTGFSLGFAKGSLLASQALVCRQGR